ncbi:LOW QUALITY PROTEIN: hypothetical protein RJ641_005522 [Dillenia turbinata]|uniref:Uncharacterized protein n=1 Tax=Dillenia turbinata TaxID=194707 RepID=A0AAN8VH53_9MAGN
MISREHILKEHPYITKLFERLGIRTLTYDNHAGCTIEHALEMENDAKSQSEMSEGTPISEAEKMEHPIFEGGRGHVLKRSREVYLSLLIRLRTQLEIEKHSSNHAIRKLRRAHLFREKQCNNEECSWGHVKDYSKSYANKQDDSHGTDGSMNLLLEIFKIELRLLGYAGRSVSVFYLAIPSLQKMELPSDESSGFCCGDCRVEIPLTLYRPFFIALSALSQVSDAHPTSVDLWIVFCIFTTVIVEANRE